ncbi:Z1 domain-containing protein [Steroidobacter flavus]|uniref:Z1 domain-containing protein n=1 Tax=Steroidobacter flavus TaxID=1842136 RepID=A0ABV8T0N4_9GAMM
MLQKSDLSASAGTLNLHGACFTAIMETLHATTSAADAQRTRQSATQVVLNAIKSYQRVFGGNDVGARGTGRVSRRFRGAGAPRGNTGLMNGRVQSGKTNASIVTVALASGNGFRCFVILTSDNTWLGRQTVERFRLQLGAGDGPIVRSWEDWRHDPEDFVRSVQPYLEDTGIVLVSTKNTKNLENLARVLKCLGADQVPGMVLDDEADNASLNTNTARMASGRTTEPSAIFALIGKIRAQMPNHVFVQITATPQSLLLQAIDHPLRPAWVVMVEPGEGYVGGETFFEGESKYIVHVDGSEIEGLRSGKVDPNDASEMPAGLRRAVCFFVTATALRELEHGRKEVLSMLIHIDHKKISHKAVESVLRRYLMWLDKALRSKLAAHDRKFAESQMHEAYEELQRTSAKLPPLSAIVSRLHSSLRNAEPQIIDADNPNQKPEYRPGRNFLIGGNRLGRGVTIEGLAVTYYARDAKTKMMDTVHQHARMFGYRKALLPITRLYSPEHIVSALKDIHSSDEGTRQLLEREGTLDVKPVWVGPKLRPTRANVLNPADLRAVVSGVTIWPPNLIHAPAKVKPLLRKLEARLAPFIDPDVYYEIPIDEMARILELMPSERVPHRTWGDERIQQLLEAMKALPVAITSGIINVRRGRRGEEGYDVSQVAQERSGFAHGTAMTKLKARYPGRPILLLRKQAGRTEKHWKGQAFYAPTLIVPQTRYAFVFVDA